MKIGIDATPLSIPFPCGTKHYSQALIKSLAAIDKTNQYILFAPTKVLIPEQKNFRQINFPNNLPVLKRQVFLHYAVNKEKVNVFHYLEPSGSVFFKHPKIVTTVHDLNLKSTYPFLSRHFLNRIYCIVSRYVVFANTKTFVSPTNFIKREIELNLLKRNLDKKVLKIYEGVDEDFKVLKEPYHKQKYFLCMGDFAPRKNIPMVLKAYSLLPLSIKEKHHLIIIVSDKIAAANFKNMIVKYKIKSSADILMSISKNSLVWFYNNSIAFIYPSLYEGFGLPILEAMSCGCPVITSNFGTMKEIAGKSAFLINPNSAGDILNAMYKIYTSQKFSKKLTLKGLKRAKKFSWIKTAQKTIKCYYEV